MKHFANTAMQESVNGNLDKTFNVNAKFETNQIKVKQHISAHSESQSEFRVGVT
jgi:hypothetical protein